MTRLLTLLALLVLAPSSSADELPVGDPAALGFSQEKLDAIEPALLELVEKKAIPGAVTMIARHGKVVYADAVGMRNHDTDEPMELDTIFRIMSMTKPLTTVTLLTFYEEGRLDLDDPVSKHLPQLVGLEVHGDDGEHTPAGREPTVRDLMRSTAGFSYGFGMTPVDRAYASGGVMTGTLESMVETLGGLPLLYSPGERWVYSISWDVQARLIEVLAGKPYDDVLRERIFEPLDMRDSGHAVPESKRDRLAASHVVGLRVMDDGQDGDRQDFVGGGHGVYSTARDYLRFAQMLANGGTLDDVRILKEETVEMMRANQLPDELVPITVLGFTMRGTGFGLGVSVLVDPGDAPRRKGEYGWAGAATTSFFIAPEDDLVAVVMSQKYPFDMVFIGQATELVHAARVED